MTSTGPFTEAARAEAERVARENAPLEYDSIREAFVDAYAAGLQARTHLAAATGTEAARLSNLRYSIGGLQDAANALARTVPEIERALAVGGDFR